MVKTVRTVATDMRFYVHQGDVVLNQANPTSGLPYAVLPESLYVRIYSIASAVTWTVQPTPLQVHLDLDGVDITHGQGNPATGTYYGSYVTEDAAEGGQQMGAANAYTPRRAFLYEGKRCTIHAETTGGTVQNLDARVKWARYI